MSKHIPPVPPAGRSDKGPGGSPEVDEDTLKHGGDEKRVSNPDEKGRTANTKQNTTHQSYSQDR